jgi:autotransporter-associated beta strand protein
MKRIRSIIQSKSWALANLLLIAAAVLLVSLCVAPAYAQRVFGVDTADVANSTAPSQTAWNNAFNDADGDGIAYKFAFVRAAYGLTTNDTQFYTNISRATTAGLLVGSYHFVTPTTTANNAVDEANHYLTQAGMYMKPGYLLPVLDLESGSGMTQLALTQWGIDYVNTIAASKGINPIVYTNSSYNNDEVNASLAFTNTSSSPHTGPFTYQWLARPGGSIVTGQPVPASGYPDPYGVWDPNFTTKTGSTDPAVKPWAFWQNGGGSPNGFVVDFNAANGNIEFVKDFLVPALWTKSGAGDWATVSNWNSYNPTGGTPSTGPASRLPNSLDWVKLQNSGGGTVTLSNGAQIVRKFYTQQPFRITGGSLSVSYLPGSGGKFEVPSEFNAVVTLANVSLSPAVYSAYTTQVDGGGGQFIISDGTVTFRNINLASHATTPGKMVITGSVTFVPSTLGGTGTATIQSTGSLAEAGIVDLGGAGRNINISDGTPTIDVSILANIFDGGLLKVGAGTLQLSGANSYSGGTTVGTGLLSLSGSIAKLGTGNVTVLGNSPGTALQILSGVSNAIADTATLSLLGGGTTGVADQGYANLGTGINETVRMLLLNGVLQGPGTYGSTSSSATFQNNEFFSGSGIVTVLIPEPASAVPMLFGLAALVFGRRRR